MSLPCVASPYCGESQIPTQVVSSMEAPGQGDGRLQSRNTTQPQVPNPRCQAQDTSTRSFQMKETKIQGQIHAPNWDKRRNHLNIQQGIRCSNDGTGMGQNIPERQTDGYRVSVMTWKALRRVHKTPHVHLKDQNYLAKPRRQFIAANSPGSGLFVLFCFFQY